MSAPERPVEHIRNALTLLRGMTVPAEEWDTRRAVEIRLCVALEELTKPRLRVTRRVRRALLVFAKEGEGWADPVWPEFRILSDHELRRAIGSYATNVIRSLEQRGLVRQHSGSPTYALAAGDFWELTDTGRDVARALRFDLTREPR